MTHSTVPPHARSSDPLEEELFTADADSDWHLGDYFELLRRKWRLIAITGVIGLAGGLFHYFNTEETFLASTRIQIERRSATPLGAQTYWMESWWNPEFYPTQHEILKSRGLAQRVVEHLRLWEDERFSPSSSVSGTLPDGPVTAASDQAVLGRLANRVRGGVDVREVRGTQLVDIVYRANDPELAMTIANAYADAFIEYSKAERRQIASGQSTFLLDEIEKIKAELEDKEKRLQDYGRNNDIVAVDPDEDPTLKRLSAINDNLLGARQRRIQAESRYNEIRNRPRDSVADTFSSGLVSSQRKDLIDLERQYRAQPYKPDYPVMVQLKAKIDQARSELDKLIDEQARLAVDNAYAEYQAAQGEERALEREYNEIKGETLKFRSASVEYNNLLIEVQTTQDLLNNLVRTQSQTNVAVSGSREATIRQIDVAMRPGGPVSPDLERSTMLGILLGLGAGIGLVLLLEFLDRSLKSADEVERRLGIPVMAVIPDISSSGKRSGYGYGYGYGARRSGRKAQKSDVGIDLVPREHPRLAVSEAYRGLRTALLLSSADELEVVAITSATAGEGKTATATNLAIVMSQLGRRVLLIDADLRKPRLHEVFGLSNRHGLVNYLVGHEQRQALVAASDDLVVLPAGPTPPNPSELLSSERMRELLEAARGRFDFVILDTPPTLAVTDSTLLGDRADGVILCVREGSVSRDDARACRDRLRLSGVRILGAVLNFHRPQAGRYGRGYSYHYQAYGNYTEELAKRTEDAVA